MSRSSTVDRVTVVRGSGPLADLVRDRIEVDQHASVTSAVIVVETSSTAHAIGDLTDEDIDATYELPMRRVIVDLQEAFRSGCTRIVVMVPTIALSGGRMFAAQAALAEGVRILVKSAARQWGSRGITVNAVAVEPEWFSIDPRVSGPISIAPPSLEVRGDGVRSSPEAIVEWLCSPAAGSITGQTIVCDGGQWM